MQNQNVQNVQKPEIKLISRDADIMIDYTDDIALVSLSKLTKTNTIKKFIHEFIKYNFAVTKINFIPTEQLEKAVEKAENGKHNTLYIDASFISLTPNIFVIRYRVDIPEYKKNKIKDIERVDYYDQWMYGIIIDFPNTIDDTEYRETHVHNIVLRKSKLKLEQIKQIVMNRIKSVLNQYADTLYRTDEKRQKFQDFITKMEQYLFPKKRQKTEQKEESNEQQ